MHNRPMGPDLRHCKQVPYVGRLALLFVFHVPVSSPPWKHQQWFFGLIMSSCFMSWPSWSVAYDATMCWGDGQSGWTFIILMILQFGILCALHCSFYRSPKTTLLIIFNCQAFEGNPSHYFSVLGIMYIQGLNHETCEAFFLVMVLCENLGSYFLLDSVRWSHFLSWLDQS